MDALVASNQVSIAFGLIASFGAFGFAVQNCGMQPAPAYGGSLQHIAPNHTPPTGDKEHWDPPLHEAVRSKNHESLNDLLEKGADPDERDKGQFTPLMIASLSGDIVAVKLLLASKANPNATNSIGASPLHYAAMMRPGGLDYTKSDDERQRIDEASTQVAEALLRAGAIANVEGGEGSSPLALAVLAGRPRLVAMLLEFGADRNRKGTQGNTPAHFLAYCFASTDSGFAICRETARILVSGDVNLDVRNQAGLTPLDVAAERCRKEIVDVFLGFTKADLIAQARKTLDRAPCDEVADRLRTYLDGA